MLNYWLPQLATGANCRADRRQNKYIDRRTIFGQIPDVVLGKISVEGGMAFDKEFVAHAHAQFADELDLAKASACLYFKFLNSRDYETHVRYCTEGMYMPKC